MLCQPLQFLLGFIVDASSLQQWLKTANPLKNSQPPAVLIAASQPWTSRVSWRGINLCSLTLHKRDVSGHPRPLLPSLLTPLPVIRHPPPSSYWGLSLPLSTQLISGILLVRVTHPSRNKTKKNGKGALHCACGQNKFDIHICTKGTKFSLSFLSIIELQRCNFFLF